MAEFNEETQGQIIHIMINDIVKFCEDKIDQGYINGSDAERIQRMFKVLHDKEKNYVDGIRRVV